MEPARGSQAYREGYLLGFFGSYELHEIPYEHQDDVAELRRKHPDK